ncbi:hypothetical protein CKO15_00540 [Halorhodospira abdelmalekii]|uniref:molybdopterin molybdotransferase MoeA n=1 Tax=Halorhodospira abdelmalekii TaxID=421629 RepID=UPI0019063642|nr:molybdopterin molybdotransferase MoeA [Halorhodospira abdelmalekii]MBK1733793.1 hypothetical protein [Halorhodospira abdelmalekii]
MISFTDAVTLIREAASRHTLATEACPLAQIDGRICAEQVTAPIALQPFDNAAMDGYAVRHADCAPASPTALPQLRIVATVTAGTPPLQHPLAAGECATVLTGAPLPPGADTIIPFEQTERTAEWVSILRPPQSRGANVRYAGEDFTAGDVVLQPGTPLTTTHLMPLAALGIEQVRVYRRPTAALITTGNELTHTLGSALAPGQIYNSTYHYGDAALRRLGCDVVHRIHLRDELDAFTATLRQLMDDGVDLLVSSGAVSAGGESDFVRAGLEQIGAKILFHKVAARPGKPALLARLPNGRLYFGLPGNPLATAVGLRLLLTPALHTMTGAAPERPLLARLTHPFEKKAGFTIIVLGTLHHDHDHRPCVKLPRGQSSFMTHAALTGNCWTLLPPGADRLKGGAWLETYPLWPSTQTDVQSLQQ